MNLGSLITILVILSLLFGLLLYSGYIVYKRKSKILAIFPVAISIIFMVTGYSFLVYLFGIGVL